MQVLLLNFILDTEIIELRACKESLLRFTYCRCSDLAKI